MLHISPYAPGGFLLISYNIYIYKTEILSVCLSVCHAVNSPGTAEINISTA